MSRIAFVTTQALEGSTVVGRVLPLASELAKNHEVHVLVHASSRSVPGGLSVHVVGRDPFERTEDGKKRLSGLRLIARLLLNVLRTFFTLLKIRPSVVVIVKSLPQNVLAVLLWRLLNPKARIVLDVDDFELTANALSSILQRAAVHWAERQGARQAHAIIAASPFLQDHFEQLTSGKKRVGLIPTGIREDLRETVRTAAKSGTASHLLYVGSISVASGHRVDLLPAILTAVRKERPETTLTIAGSGDDIALLKQEFQALKLETAVTWTGRFSLADIPLLLKDAPLLLDPIDGSIVSRAKSSFRVLLAAAAGLPIVTSNIGIRPQLLPEQFHSRFFAEAANIDSYAQRITALLTQPLTAEEARLLSDHAMQYTWKNLSKLYAQHVVV